MATNSRIVELAALIQSNTNRFEEYLSTNGIKSPSFSPDTPERNATLPAEIAEAQEVILDATNELHNLILGPVRFLTECRNNFPVCLQAIEKFGIAKSFPVDSEATFAEIANTCNLAEDDVRRILRQAITQHVFKEARKGIVVHTTISRLLAENPLVQDLVAFQCREEWASAPRVVDAMIKWPGSEEPEHTAWTLANNCTGSIMAEVMKDANRARRIPGAMVMIESSGGFGPEYFIEAFEWTGVKKFVDVGGASGSVAIAIIKSVPDVCCIVQDVPMVTKLMEAIPQPADVASRLEYKAHDFMTPQTERGADVYFFRWIFHDWSDKYAVKILQNLIPGLKKGARVVANETVLPEFRVLSPYRESSLRNYDLDMKALMNGKERDAAEWAALFEAADPRFRFQGIKYPTGAKLAVIEATWEGE